MHVLMIFLAKSYASRIILLVMPCLDELNARMLENPDTYWTDYKSESVLFPSSPQCLDVQPMPNLKFKPAKYPIINKSHAKLILGHDNTGFITHTDSKLVI